STYLYDDALKHARVLHEEHSFPTRRSSDLSIQKSGKKELELCLYVLILKPHSRLQKRSLRLAGYSPIQTAGLQSDNLHHRALNRSEEHTSELQSRENLVCRLLLEKKKKRRP